VSASRVVPPALAVLFGVVLLVGLSVLAVGLAYAFGAIGLIALALGCSIMLTAALIAVRRRAGARGVGVD